MRFFIYFFNYTDYKDDGTDDKDVVLGYFDPLLLRVDIRVACRASGNVLVPTEEGLEVEFYASWRTPSGGTSNDETPMLESSKESELVEWTCCCGSRGCFRQYG
jgi:hypothetical protein